MVTPQGSGWVLAAGTGDQLARRHLEVSQRLRERRRALGLTQKQVTSRLHRLGVSSTNKALSSLEHGAGLDVARLPELAAALDCTVTWLLGLTDDPHRWEPDTGRAALGSGTASGQTSGLASGAAPARTPEPSRGFTTSRSPSGPRRPEPVPPGPWILGPMPPEP